MTDTNNGLDKAYALETPDDNISLYRDWAETYDSEFAVNMDYQLPERVAEVFAKYHQSEQPILDVGAGTGLVGKALASHGIKKIDALDISPEMLEVAGRLGCYSDLIVADLTVAVNIPDNTYGAMVSAGTFTLGHVGPDALDELIRIAKPGGFFALSVNGEHFEAQGFADKFEALDPKIRDFTPIRVKYYGENAQGDHKNDTGWIAVFWKR
jgi:predicted TPR repeat methyltransferase